MLSLGSEVCMVPFFNISLKVSALKVVVDGGTMIDEKDIVYLTEMLMRQLLKLDGIDAEGEGRVQRKMEVRISPWSFFGRNAQNIHMCLFNFVHLINQVYVVNWCLDKLRRLLQLYTFILFGVYIYCWINIDSILFRCVGFRAMWKQWTPSS